MDYDGENAAENYKNFPGVVQRFLVPYIMNYLAERKRKFYETVDDDFVYGLMIDVGCGDGKSAIPFADRFRSVLGYDISKEQIKMALSTKFPDNILYQVAKEDSIPALDASADLITSAYAVQHTNFESFFNECKRVIKPSGIIAIYGSMVRDIYWDNFPENAGHNKTLSAGCVFKSYTDKLMKHFDDIGHPDWHVINRYQKILEGEYGLGKFRRDDLEFTETMSLSQFIRSMDYVPSWKEFNDNMDGKMRKSQQLEHELKSFWNITDVDGEDIMLKTVRSIYLLIFSRELSTAVP